jgi:hypothetical protein
MRLVMCCQVLPGRDYVDDLRYSAIAAEFWMRTYPEGEVYLATNATADMPEHYPKSIKTMRFPFERLPSAAARANFLAAYAASPLFDRDTVFTGHDVLVQRPFPPVDAKVVTNYRYHPSQPYCSDLLIIKVEHKDYATKLLDEIFMRHRWMPKPILDGAADQLSWALTFGVPENDAFNGMPFYTPRRPDVLALPVNDYLYTANDAFPAEFARFTGAAPDHPEHFAYLAQKTALHFKGNRKPDFFRYAEWVKSTL